MPRQAFQIQLLGKFEVRVNERAIPDTEWRSKRARSLVKLLALAPRQRLARDQVLDTLWPDSDFSAANNNLHQTLFTARKIFEKAGLPALALEGGQLCLGEEVWVDAEQFEAAAAQASASQDPTRYQVALDLYAGQLLPEDLYEEWTLTRRESLRLLQLNLLLALARLREAHQEYPFGIAALGQVLAVDRANEEAHTLLMRLYALSGQRQLALRQFQLLQDALQSELAVSPGPAAIQLFEQIQAGKLFPQPTPERVQPLQSFPTLPSGTVTFFFTDIEASTPLWEQQPQAMSIAVARHHAILREAIEGQSGIIFKVVGDQLQAAFPLAPQAVQAALAAQLALSAEAWPAEIGSLRVRMGLHSGEAVPQEGDYAVSHTLNRVSRVMSAGLGGQVLLSRAAAELANRQLPQESELLDLGEHELKGLQQREHLYQLWAPGLRRDFPRLPGALSHKHNLPAPLTSFIGREDEIRELSQKVNAQRLVTLTGSGGTGKTRLALQVAGQVLEGFPDGVFLVELAPLSDPALIPQVCLQVMDLAAQPGQAPLATLTGYLAKKHLLLVLDNCEHMTQACARLVSQLLRDCPRLHILATSREILAAQGELAFRVPSLSFPQERSLPSLAELAQYEAVRLLVERAAQVQPGFELNSGNASALAQICARLDGIPLAIELAAARLRLLSPSQIAARLDQVFCILTGGSQAVLPRQQTLKAMIDWSYNLLSAREGLLLQRLAVFAGGWSLEAAEAVCADEAGSEACSAETLAADEILDLLAQLVDKSLAIVLVQPGGARYRLLETVRQYARDRLVETGCGSKMRDLHLAYYARLSGAAEPHLRGKGQVEWLEHLDEELDNLRAALEWSLSRQAVSGLKIHADLRWFWHLRGLFDEGVDWLEKLLAAEVRERAGQPLSAERALQRARALRSLGAIQFFGASQRQAPSHAPDEESIAILRTLQPAHRLELAISLFYDLQHSGQLGQPSPDREEMLAIFHQENAKFYISEFYFSTWRYAPDLEQGLEILKTSLALCRELEDWDGIAGRSSEMALSKNIQGEYAEARTLVQEALGAARRVKNRWLVALLQNYLAQVALSEGDYPGAIRQAQEAIDQFRAINYLNMLDGPWGNLQQAAWAIGDFENSRRYAREIVTAFPGMPPMIYTNLYLGRVALSQQDIALAAACLRESYSPTLWKEFSGAGWLDSIPLKLGGIRLFVLQEHFRAAAFLIGSVDDLYRRASGGCIKRERSEYEEDYAATRAALGEEDFRAACAPGAGLDFDQVRPWFLANLDELTPL